MKLRITHLKAPWPEGAKVGDVVELDVSAVSAVPAWAVGKCEQIHEDAEPAPKADDSDPDDMAAAEAQALAERQAIADRQAKEVADVKPEPAAKPAAGAKSAAKPAAAG